MKDTAYSDRIICLRSDAFYQLLNEVVEHIQNTHQLPREQQWMGAEDAMKLLGIKSRTSLQKLRDQGKFRFAQFEKNILYDRHSLLAYIEENVKPTF